MSQPQKSKKQTRRRFIQIASLGAAAVVTDAFLIEPKRVVITRHRLPVVGKSASGESVGFVQLTDLHLQPGDARMRQIAKNVKELKPDFVVFTGDSIDRSDRIPELGKFLDMLDPATPKFATVGNWEYWGNVNFSDLGKTYADRNGRLLINETAAFLHGGQRVLVSGLDTEQGGSPSLTLALRNVEPAANHVVLAHCPIQREQIAAEISRNQNDPSLPDLSRYSIQCVLSGHTHGGQVTAFGAAPYCPPGSGRYVRGWYKDASPPLYVSRGLGNSIFPARFCATPEIACFDWMLEKTV